MVILYSTHCPKCNILAKKLQMANIDYIENNNTDEMLAKGMLSAPYLELEDGTLLDFMQANNWLKR